MPRTITRRATSSAAGGRERSCSDRGALESDRDLSALSRSSGRGRRQTASGGGEGGAVDTCTGTDGGFDRHRVGPGDRVGRWERSDRPDLEHAEEHPCPDRGAMKTAVVDLVARRLVNGDVPSNMQCLVVALGSMALVPGERAAVCLMSGTRQSWRMTTNEGADTIGIYKSSCPRCGRAGSDAIDAGPCWSRCCRVASCCASPASV